MSKSNNIIYNLTPEADFYTEVGALLQHARNKAYKVVNTIMVQTYWQIGKRIVEQEQKGQNRAGYGDYLITNLSRHLSDNFGKGFSEANLWNMKQFYQTFPDFKQFSTQCVGNLSWTNTRLIMRIEDQKEREYYLKGASSQNWSSRQLERNIKSEYYHRLLSTQQQNVTSTSNHKYHIKIYLSLLLIFFSTVFPKGKNNYIITLFIKIN